MDNGDWIHEKWEEISNRVDKAERDINDAETLAKKLLVDIEFLRIMFDEDML
jgi:hypothetical protein